MQVRIHGLGNPCHDRGCARRQRRPSPTPLQSAVNHDAPPPFRLSVLDQSPIPEGSTAGDALRASIELARHADRLGFHRYWVAEHHASPALACRAPEVLIGPLAAATRRIRLGSGGIMLPHYSPLKVAETFGMLAAMYPGRIDLGIGRAAGTDARTTFALQRDRRQANPDDFLQQLDELLAYVNGTMPDGHPFARIADSLPAAPGAIPVYLLGSSPQSAVWAADLSLPYVFADFINPVGTAIAAHYRANYVATASAPRPYQIVCASVVCADTDDEAQFLAGSHRMLLDHLHRGRLIPVPSPEKADAYLRAIGSPIARR
jgi:luciferase family oxidoreductase group 1